MVYIMRFKFDKKKSEKLRENPKRRAGFEADDFRISRRKEDNMQITINFPDDIGRQIQQLPDADGFISTLVKQALENRRSEGDSEEQGGSRWARFSERIRKNPPLSGAGDYVRECSREFRGEFAFRHDSE
ncbi:hypothetical protein QUF80_16940 [Desulfococcaceae bacterium HSG8]|nr:hypothetical protein [Desulfococcaceae bacterium HSG8]